MLLNLLFTNPPEFILIFGGLIIAIGLHEAAHCYMTDRLGDPTPRSAGRLTLNPLAHLDPIGTLAIVIANFGWGKSAPFDPYNLSNPKRDIPLIALAGPATNFALAILTSVILRLFTLPENIIDVLFTFLVLNLNLGLFNLIPIPPLDGSKILFGQKSLNINPNSYFLLIILLVTGIIPAILRPITNLILSVLI